MPYIDIRNMKGLVDDTASTVHVKWGKQQQNLQFAYQKTGFGKKRFFICPICSRRVEKLYLHNNLWRCRKCSGANPYYGIQNSTKGGYDEIAYRMERYAERGGIDFTLPFDYLAYIHDPRIKRKKFREQIKVLQALENMRFSAIFLNAKYKPRLIQSVVNGTHPIIQQTTLRSLRDDIFDWHSGNQLHIDPKLLVKSLII